jgi:hypothetical protein
MRDIRSTPNRLLVANTAMLGMALLGAFLARPVSAQVADNAANPKATVPAVSYRSVFKETSLGVEKDTDNWRKANDTVGKFLRGHVDILKWEEQESAKALKNGMDKPATAQPSGAITSMPDATKSVAAPAHKH